MNRVLGCQVIKHCLQQLATQYQYVKLINMQSTDCIPNYPDSNLPTLLVYRDGQCARTIVGLRTLGGNRISPESEYTCASSLLAPVLPAVARRDSWVKFDISYLCTSLYLIH